MATPNNIENGHCEMSEKDKTRLKSDLSDVYNGHSGGTNKSHIGGGGGGGGIVTLGTLQHPNKMVHNPLSEYEDSYYVNQHGNYPIVSDYQHLQSSHPITPIPSSTKAMKSRELIDNVITDVIGLGDICANRKLWKMLLGEFIGTLFLVFIGCGSTLNWTGTPPSMVQISLCFGITVATLAVAIGNMSGCHINPAVSLGLLCNGNTSFLKFIVFVAAQCLGAIAGSAILESITPAEIQGDLGLTSLNPKVDVIKGLFLEALITFVLVLTVCSVCDPNRKDTHIGPLIIGLSITTCHLMAIQYTGSSMNPARSFGPAVITKKWKDHWVYWAGPLMGGAIGGFIHKVAFKEDSEDEEEETYKKAN